MDNRVKEYFEKAGGPGFEPTPYLTTRILATLRESRGGRGMLPLWKRLSLTTGLLMALLVVTHFWLGRSGSELAGPINQKMLVRVELGDLKNHHLAYAQVKVSDGVRFVSNAFPEVAHLKKIFLPVSGKSNDLPFVILATQRGIGSVQVSFFDEKDQLLRQRELKINFGS